LAVDTARKQLNDEIDKLEKDKINLERKITYHRDAWGKKDEIAAKASYIPLVDELQAVLDKHCIVQKISFYALNGNVNISFSISQRATHEAEPYPTKIIEFKEEIMAINQKINELGSKLRQTTEENIIKDIISSALNERATKALDTFIALIIEGTNA
jgi:predicted  nucleic acid-binding Zn-ribbon protein